MAESAARVGARVVAVDFFGDRDQARAAESHAVDRDLGLPATAAGLVRAARRLGGDAAIYGANLENHPAAIARLARTHEVLGNPAEVVREVRDWRALRRYCQEAGIAHPTTLLAGEESSAREKGGAWLRKRVRSGGGHGVRPWDGAALDRAHLLQEEVAGRAASAAFVADGHAARLFALTEQLTGNHALGARGHAWCGNILPFAAAGASRPDDAATMPDPGGSADERLVAAVARVAGLLTARFGLRGVNGLDLVMRETRDGVAVPLLVEVNPRFTASMELAERAWGVNVFTAHLEACAGRLPGASPAAGAGLPADLARPPAGGFVGKAIVFARRSSVAPETGAWLEETLEDAAGASVTAAIRDVPAGGRRIRARHPVCTVFAAGEPTRDACLERLHEAAATMYGRLRHGGRREEVRRERTTHADQRTHA